MAGGIPLHPAKKKVLIICSELAILPVINLFEDVYEVRETHTALSGLITCVEKGRRLFREAATQQCTTPLEVDTGTPPGMIDHMESHILYVHLLSLRGLEVDGHELFWPATAGSTFT
jgi:hypothetical protein